ncbi:MAG TPA: hypothetical protein VL443_30030 [Cyclobacteriaceae bacterium]|jgi:hypothetical protein|nr:hypothetical protein [Cyclobacteriaceae bacterium]
MAQIISASIDLNKIDKSKIKPGKDGAKYYNIQIIVNDEPNKYGQDVSISENQTKEQRDVGEKKKYIGNGKTVWKSQASINQSANASEHNDVVGSDSLPF